MSGNDNRGRQTGKCWGSQLKLDNWLAQRSQTCPDRVALVTAAGQLTYSELENEAERAARRLVAHGVRRGANVALTMDGGPDQVVLIHALMKTGAVVLPLSPKLSAQERAHAIEVGRVTVDLDDPNRLTQTEADMPLLGEHDMEDVHCQILTSGSTGLPHTVELTYGNHLFSAMGSAFRLGVDPQDRWLCAVPLSHISGLSIIMRSVITGTGVVLHDRFRVEDIARSIEEDGVTVISLVSTTLLRLLDAEVDLPKLRVVLVGGGPIPQSAIETALDRGASVVSTYGLTETCSQVTTLEAKEARRKAGSVGRPLLTSHLRIQDGEILVQGPTVSAKELDSDGWLHTGDMGTIDEDGFLFVQGRTDDLIITGGENVFPGEVEDVLVRHPDILEAAVIGRPDPEWQNAITAVVVLRDGASLDPEMIKDHCRTLLAAYKVPKSVEIATDLPRTASGKLKRSALR